MKNTMTPPAGMSRRVSFALRDCSLGLALIGASADGLCALMLGDDRETLLRAARARFPDAEAGEGGADFESLATRALELIEQPGQGWDLPLDIEGTPFQRRVWKALCEIPRGSTTSYAQIAERIGQPRAARAVAGACAANRIAVAIPCHRVVRGDGDLAGYRWGVARKRELLAREAAAA
jgi:AraC family transcriptional regulator, regulatory protein of adaptative response / methylated-DNA-[protein]-cysteine methyltransferase